MIRKKKDALSRGIVEETLGGMSEYKKLLKSRSEIKLLKETAETDLEAFKTAIRKASVAILQKDLNVTKESLNLSLQVYETMVREYSAMRDFTNDVNRTLNEIDSVVEKIESSIKMENTLNLVSDAVGSSLTGQTLVIPPELIARIYSLKNSSNLTLHSTKALVQLRSEV